MKKKLLIKTKSENLKVRLPKQMLAVATKATHTIGDLSREEVEGDITENLCVISGESRDYYWGSWVTGIGAFNVKFHKETTRGLTDEEWDKVMNMKFAINNQPSWDLNGLERF